MKHNQIKPIELSSNSLGVAKNILTAFPAEG